MIVALDHRSAHKFFELAKQTRPPHVQKLKDKIEGKIRVAEFRASMNGGLIDEDLIQ